MRYLGGGIGHLEQGAHQETTLNMDVDPEPEGFMDQLNVGDDDPGLQDQQQVIEIPDQEDGWEELKDESKSESDLDSNVSQSDPDEDSDDDIDDNGYAFL